MTPATRLATVIVQGPYGDQQANQHTGLPGGEVDFFVGSAGFSECSSTDCQAVDPATTPEPATLFLFASGLLGVTIAARKRRKA